MSDSELLRIKNKQKASYKSRKNARSNKKSLYGLMTNLGLTILVLILFVEKHVLVIHFE